MRIVWSPRAIRHLRALRDYIAGDSPPSARAIAARILSGVELLATQPHMGRPGRVAGTRELVVPGTPYVIPYRARGEGLEVLAVFHGAQKWPKSL
jgi:toxin ParE1/3/4